MFQSMGISVEHKNMITKRQGWYETILFLFPQQHAIVTNRYNNSDPSQTLWDAQTKGNWD